MTQIIDEFYQNYHQLLLILQLNFYHDENHTE